MNWSAKCGVCVQIGFANWFHLFVMPWVGFHPFSANLEFFGLYIKFVFPLFPISCLTCFLKILNGFVSEIWCVCSNWLWKRWGWFFPLFHISCFKFNPYSKNLEWVGPGDVVCAVKLALQIGFPCFKFLLLDLTHFLETVSPFSLR